MGERWRGFVLRVLRVPTEPEPPPGDPSTVRIFRASPRYYRYRWVGWAARQVGALMGLILGIILLGLIEDRFDHGWIGPALTAAEVLAWAGFLAQLPLTLAALRLDYELRWYMLSDRALRIREGILSVRERTMTFANLQQISIRQGPLQRLLGIADVEVRTAGGGGSDGESGEGGDLHRGYLRGVEDATALRDAIRTRVQRYRDAGLGDPGDGARSLPTGRARVGEEAIAAARTLRDEVRALRRAAVA